MNEWLEKRTLLARCLWPLSQVFLLLSTLRKRYWQAWSARHPLNAPPIVIIGNIRVGGVGKTPLLIHLVQALQAAHCRVGVISRGYGGSQTGWVTSNSDPRLLGDEPVMIAQLAPVVVHPDRRRAVQLLLAKTALAQTPVDLILSDDGLQHYRLPRDYEVVVMDARGIGNGYLLPAGPLRENVDRLQTVNHIVLNQTEAQVLPAALLTPRTHMHLSLLGLFRVLDDQPVPIEQWQQPLHAVCGIGYPPRFFDSLQQLKLDFTPHIFSDHHAFVASDLPNDRPIVMTQKDAVKIRAFATPQHWYLRIAVQLDSAQLLEDLLALSLRYRHNQGVSL
jgi:tetraacyldisaccharide 4'-kinase